MESINASVGAKAVNAKADQEKIQRLLNQVAASSGGPLKPLDAAIQERVCSSTLQEAIFRFQKHGNNVEPRFRDGRIDPGGQSLRKLNALAHEPLVGPQGLDPSLIRLHQTNPASLSDPHVVSVPIILPVSAGNKLIQGLHTAMIREYLFEMKKDGATFWVGAAVPEGTSDFSKAQVFFHPTVVQNGIVRAADSDYRTFTGGWPKRLQTYVAIHGAQLFGLRQMPLIVPFMTMAALGKTDSYMFGTRAQETLNAILTAVRNAAAPAGASASTGSVQASSIGVSSFSSGIYAMRQFAATFGGSGLIRELTDFDSPFIVIELKKPMTAVSGAVSRVFTQKAWPHPSPKPSNWVTLSGFQNITAYPDKGPPHGQIGRMVSFIAAMSSVV
jgi:hypothetical protein